MFCLTLMSFASRVSSNASGRTVACDWKWAIRFACALFLFSQSVVAQPREELLERMQEGLRWTENVSLRMRIFQEFDHLPGIRTESAILFLKRGNENVSWKGTIDYRDKTSGEKHDFDVELLEHIQMVFNPMGGEEPTALFEEHRFSYGTTVNVTEKGWERTRLRMTEANLAGPMFGYVTSAMSAKTIPDLLKRQGVSTRIERLRETQCVVISADLPAGKLEVWVAPDRGHSIQRFKMEKIADVHEGDHGTKFHLEYEVSGRSVAVDRIIVELDVLQLENIDGYFVPTVGEFKTKEIRSDGHVSEGLYTFEFTDVELNPDFSADSFRFRVPEGTEVFRTTNNRAYPGFIWSKGKVELER